MAPGKNGKPISQNQLARLLKGPGLCIAPNRIGIEAKRGRRLSLRPVRGGFCALSRPGGGFQTVQPSQTSMNRALLTRLNCPAALKPGTVANARSPITTGFGTVGRACEGGKG